MEGVRRPPPDRPFRTMMPKTALCVEIAGRRNSAMGPPMPPIANNSVSGPEAMGRTPVLQAHCARDRLRPFADTSSGVSSSGSTTIISRRQPTLRGESPNLLMWSGILAESCCYS